MADPDKPKADEHGSLPSSGVLSFAIGGYNALISSAQWVLQTAVQMGAFAHEITQAEIDAHTLSPEETQTKIVAEETENKPKETTSRRLLSLPSVPILNILTTAIDTLEKFPSTDGITKEIIEQLEFLEQEHHDPAIVHQLRITLSNLLNSNIERDGIRLADAVYETLVALAKYAPIHNFSGTLFYKLLEEERAVFTSTGDLLDAVAIIEFNMFSSAPNAILMDTHHKEFHPKDAEQINDVYLTWASKNTPAPSQSKSATFFYLSTEETQQRQQTFAEKLIEALHLIRLFFRIISVGLGLSSKKAEEPDSFESFSRTSKS